MSAIPFGLYQGPRAADGYLIGRVNQELMSEELMRSGSDRTRRVSSGNFLHIKRFGAEGRGDAQGDFVMFGLLTSHFNP